MAIFQAAAEFVAAVVGACDGELVEQVALRAHDLDAIEAGALGEFGAAHIVLNRLPDFGRAQGARRARVDWRRDVGGAHRPGDFCIAAGVQDLQNDLAALGMHRLRDRFERIGLFLCYEQGTRFIQQAILARGITARDDQADATARPLGIEQGQPVNGAVQRLQSRVHGTHQNPVAQDVRTDSQGRQQSWKGRRGFMGHSEILQHI